MDDGREGNISSAAVIIVMAEGAVMLVGRCIKDEGMSNPATVVQSCIKDS